MLRPESLDAKDVLKHLNSLGYYDITPKQFKDFLHDLKKLIKYDQKEALKSKDLQDVEWDCSCSQCGDRSEKLSSNDSPSDSCTSSDFTSVSYNCNKNIKLSAMNKRCSNNPTDSQIAQKAQISFIRPWNIQGYKIFSNRGRKNVDPVRLYHQYKEFWNRQCIPGESKHSDLRWVIRNRMLGQEPNPKVYISSH